MATDRKAGGNAGKGVVGQQAYTAELAQEMARLYQFEHWYRGNDTDEFEIEAIRVRFPRGENGDFLVIVTAWVDGEPKVGFNGGATFLEALKGALERIRNRSMKWKDNQYAGK